MKFKSLFLSAVLLLCAGFLSHAQAQFQGKIEMKSYYVDEDDGDVEVNTINMFVTDTRIMIQGEQDMDIANGMSAAGLLIRNDHKDFVLLMEEKQALQITKTEIEGLVEMMAAWGGAAQPSEKEEFPSYRFTDRTRTILGRECAEMVVEDEENPGDYLSIWLTPKVNINWGMLAEPWKGLPKGREQEVQRISQDLLFQGKNFPMLVESYEDGKTTKLFEVTKMEESSIAKAMVEVPAGTVVLSARDFIFNMMMQQQ